MKKYLSSLLRLGPAMMVFLSAVSGVTAIELTGSSGLVIISNCTSIE